jgi:hypothetical protein
MTYVVVSIISIVVGAILMFFAVKKGIIVIK